ncbi:hypothetical protein IE53DRAFT_309578 [Violaceomyces palustris]|uniref:Uncharacterized protein n=1 Tax=Violaceomyces palustris TaxID=1673888 RepID=A0ACD0P6Y9_9BASI|nr:hypothetical protein IE53DRAFT_309578 [Violaceomyces palustris]
MVNLFSTLPLLSLFSLTLALALSHASTVSQGETNPVPSPLRLRALSQASLSQEDSLRSHLQKRQDQDQYQSIANEDETDPVKAATDVQNLEGIPGVTDGSTRTDLQITKGEGNTAQLEKHSTVPWVASPDTGGDPTYGWTALPEMEGFQLNRTWEVQQGMIMPFYITDNYRPGQDNSAIKRAIISFPGKPRDSWKYGNLFRNALAVINANETYGISSNQVLVISPAWMNHNDSAAGAVRDGELYWHGSQWMKGGNSRNPGLTDSISTFSVLDNFTDWLFLSGEFPNLNQVVIAGHSMGGQATQRYALIKKQKSYDPNMKYWIGNPGSFAWLTEDRPYPNATCSEPDDWHYGIGNYSSVVKYARNDIKAGKQEVIDRYRSRKVHYAFGLLDNGKGDTHCQAVMQGGNHLDRGSRFIMMLGGMDGGFPIGTQTVDFIPGVSHQDYPMMCADESLEKLFLLDFNTKFPSLTDVSNPGDTIKPKKKKLPGGKKTFDTPEHERVAYSLLGGSLLLVAVFFTALPFLFSPNFDRFETHSWETESKRKLL